MGRQVLKKLAERLRAMESTAAEKFLELGELLGAISHPTTLENSVTAL